MCNGQPTALKTGGGDSIEPIINHRRKPYIYHNNKRSLQLITGESMRTQPLFGKILFYRIFRAEQADPEEKMSLGEKDLLLLSEILEIQVVDQEHLRRGGIFQIDRMFNPHIFGRDRGSPKQQNLQRILLSNVF